jgi:hypothetical protein
MCLEMRVSDDDDDSAAIITVRDIHKPESLFAEQHTSFDR